MSAASSSQPTAPRLLAADRSGLLQDYFASGWAFLCPYLFFYLLYYLCHGPVNYSRGGVPSLVMVYLGLHLFHAGLGTALLWSGWSRPEQAGTARHWFVVPWLLLALVIFIPGIYWEFPNDTWEHFARINNWSLSPEVGANSDWRKTSYFLVYTLVRLFPPSGQAVALECCYTAVVLLLCWQYYRLARDLALNSSAAFLFVVLQLFLAGNNIFAFHRYYGVASTVPAQLAAVALIRLGLQAARQSSLRDALTGPGRLIAAAFLLALIVFNHPQALAFAAIGLSAAVLWRLRELRPHVIWWLLGAVLAASVFLAWWWPVHSAYAGTLRAAGWLGAWGGFNFLPGSPAQARGLQILGLLGVLNVLAGFVLLRRNRLAGWLTVLPVLVLLLPVTALPLAEALARQSDIHIILFHRVLLGIPSGLALVVLTAEWHERRPAWIGWQRAIPAALPVGLALLLVIPAGAPGYNRLWHALMVPPEDLTLRPVVQFLNDPAARARRTDKNNFMTAPAAGFVAAACGWPAPTTFGNRLISYPEIAAPSRTLLRGRDYLTGGRSRPLLLFVPAPLTFSSPLSQAGLLSGHWLHQEVALGTAGQPEMLALARGMAPDEFPYPGGSLFLLGPR